jgi:PAS domain S-box-containing protein
VQIARLSGLLPEEAAPRLERLRGFGARLGGTVVCLCSRIAIAGTTAILVVGTESGKAMALPERGRRLLADFGGDAALFAADGEWAEGLQQDRGRFGDAENLTALGAEQVARDATLNGRADGVLGLGPVTMLRLGSEALYLLLVARTPGKQAAAPIATAAAPPLAAAAATVSHLPLRFVWHMDADNRFTHGIEDFARLLGPQTAATLIRPWDEIAAELELDHGNAVARALESRETWSGVTLHWPVDDSDERLPIEMSGLPVFDRDRRFVGFRGFGICRAVERATALQARRSRAAAAPQPPPSHPPTPQRSAPKAIEEPPAKVLAFPASPPVPVIPPVAATASPERPPPPGAGESTPALSPGEHSAFQELARELSERLKKGPGRSAPAARPEPPAQRPVASPPRAADTARDTSEGRPILEKLPVGILVYRLNNLLYANRAFLDWTGYPDLEALGEAGGLDSLFIETNDTAAAPDGRNGGKTLTISTVNGNRKAVEGRLFSVSWNRENALVLMINTQPNAGEQQARATDQSLRRVEAENQELRAILDTATDGVLVLDRAGRILSANRSAQALFGYDAAAFVEHSLGDLFAPESRRSVLDHLDRLARNGGPESFDAGREAIGRVRQGGLVPLFITMGRIEDGEKLCAVLRDMTAWKRTEEELINARQLAEKASTAKSEFLAKISHEFRTPLNAIIGFSEVMMNERFGPVGNERYQQYLKDIHSSGSHVISLLNDLLDLSKIETGKLDLSFVSIDLNELVQGCVAAMQPDANRERVIIRTSLPPGMPQIVADSRSVRQIVLNLLSNSIRYTGAGGQVIVSTALTDGQEVVLRVRDTGHGMSEKALQTALEPFRELATAARWGATGTGLGLPITKALAEANHARFHITSRVDDGTLVEVTFPGTRTLAQ